MTKKDIILPFPKDVPARGRLVLFHGMTGTPDEMRDVATYFNNRGFAVVLPCLSGHGTSIEELRYVPLSEWTADAERARDTALELGSGPLYSIGQSFGGLLSLHIAEDRRHPLSALALLSPPIRFSSALRENGLSLLSCLPDSILDKFGVVKKQRRPSGIFIRPRESYPVHSVAAGARMLRLRKSVLLRLSQVECPILVLQDPRDHHLSNDIPRILRKAASSAELKHVWIPGGQHELAMGLQSERVLQELDVFLSTVL